MMIDGIPAPGPLMGNQKDIKLIPRVKNLRNFGKNKEKPWLSIEDLGY